MPVQLALKDETAQKVKMHFFVHKSRFHFRFKGSDFFFYEHNACTAY